MTEHLPLSRDPISNPSINPPSPWLTEIISCQKSTGIHTQTVGRHVQEAELCFGFDVTFRNPIMSVSFIKWSTKTQMDKMGRVAQSLLSLPCPALCSRLMTHGPAAIVSKSISQFQSFDFVCPRLTNEKFIHQNQLGTSKPWKQTVSRVLLRLIKKVTRRRKVTRPLRRVFCSKVLVHVDPPTKRVEVSDIKNKPRGVEMENRGSTNGSEVTSFCPSLPV